MLYNLAGLMYIHKLNNTLLVAYATASAALIAEVSFVTPSPTAPKSITFTGVPVTIEYETFVRLIFNL